MQSDHMLLFHCIDLRILAIQRDVFFLVERSLPLANYRVLSATKMPGQSYHRGTMTFQDRTSILWTGFNLRIRPMRPFFWT